MDSSNRIKKLYDMLYERYGPQGWWPGDSALECAIGAILTQNTSWKNAAKAIQNLKEENILSFQDLENICSELLAQIIRPSGYYNQKAVKIKRFIKFVRDKYEGSLDRMFGESHLELRENLLKIKGIGPETADTILLYAGHKPAFVVDAYTYRILSRHNLVPEQTNYGEMQELFNDSLKESVGLYNEYHALIVKVGKEHCRKSNPICEGCPLVDDPHNTFID